jgi:D-alanyl-D-alanine carboxypeptidase/D-alanyl-D-alanine carboxypeptidase (penicillin-binding protein 5/6)
MDEKLDTMKRTGLLKGWLSGLVGLLLATALHAAPPGISARAWVLLDQASGRELASHQADLALAPASLTKMMTAYLLFSDVAGNKLSLGELLTVPESAVQADGAKVFLQAGEQVSVDTLLQAMLVQSASDATLTLVTAASGNETAFVERMNREAKRLGMTRTRFMNATGLSVPGHVSTARDMALLGRALLRDYPERIAYFTQKELDFKGIVHYNRNRLLWRDETVNGLKAGRSAEAGYCLAATAERGNQRRVAVVLGARTDTLRAQDALNLLNYGFEQFESALLYRARQPLKHVKLYRGARSTVSLGFAQDFHLLTPRGTTAKVKAEIITQQPVVAPIRRGQRLGTLRLTLDGRSIGDYPLVALHEVRVAGILGRGWDSIRLLFAK